MKCKFCGKENQDQEVYCLGCGRRLDDEPYFPEDEEVITPTTVKQTADMPPMKWYKFLIYFSLFAGAVLNTITGIMILTGAQYNTSGEGMAELVYAFFPGLKTADVFYGLALLALSALLIYTRFALSGYKKNAPMCLMISYAAGAVVSIIYVVLVTAVIQQSAFDVSTVFSIVTSIVMVIINYIYFEKRKHLFVK